MATILHLSDLHLGPATPTDLPDDHKSDIVPPNERATRLTMLKGTLTQLATLLRTQGTTIDSVIVTGDITVANKEEGFVLFDEVLSWLGDSRPHPSKTVVVPGNHDVQWGAKDPNERYRHFIKYIRGKGCVTPLLEGIDYDTRGNISAVDVSRHFLLSPDNAWAVMPINSSHYCGSVESLTHVSEETWKDLPTAGPSLRHPAPVAAIANELERHRLFDVARVSRDQLAAVRELRRAIEAIVGEEAAKRLILVGAIHHQLLPVTVREELKPFESITNLGHLRYVLRDNDFAIVLHGHKHFGYAYYDYVHALEHPESSPPHRVLVLSAPNVATPTGEPTTICRLLTIGSERFARNVSASDIAAIEEGLSFQLPKPTTFSIERPVTVTPLTVAPVNLVEGASVDETYEKAIALFRPSDVSTLVTNLICRIATAEHPVLVPASYPDVPDEDTNTWFRTTVSWWQKKDFKKLKQHLHFNHGNRIYSYDQRDQLAWVIKAMCAEPLTSRGIITLLKPRSDHAQQDTPFPSFCFVQFAVRSTRPGGDAWLDVVAHFRKQEIRYWWPVNVAELAQLQHEVFGGVAEIVSDLIKQSLRIGSITTIAAIAHVGDKVPSILVPAVDFDLEENPARLWDMTYSLCWPKMARREEQVAVWRHVMKKLEPPTRQDSAGVPVPVQGIDYLAELAEHLARHHGGVMPELARRWRELEGINRAHAESMAKQKPSEAEHLAWRTAVLAKLQDIAAIVHPVLDGTAMTPQQMKTPAPNV